MITHITLVNKWPRQWRALWWVWSWLASWVTQGYLRGECSVLYKSVCKYSQVLSNEHLQTPKHRHLAMVPVMYKHCILSLPWTPPLGMSAPTANLFLCNLDISRIQFCCPSWRVIICLIQSAVTLQTSAWKHCCS